ncbi:hypothetical protein [Parahaliea mediterranea]|uniref:Uncharacterized protein n=1 Tax=Parahaliea mediterranea TaxID=651086 RepID=A0A939IMK5_9GAMM|nr:hypothetical protein [Parahaliea mediterranea]MBN7797133.1 hypothetical protein [Parahaliea mediterranea]
MSDLQLTHIALVGARIQSFRPYGYNSREELTMCRVVPEAPTGERQGSLRAVLEEQLPIWIHNIITDPDFPQRNRLLMPLRRFEGELRDKKENEVVSSVLRHGFKSMQMDPLNLPRTMPMRQRCAMVVHLDVWREAYLRLSSEVVEILAANSEALGKWCEFARHPEHAAVG